MSANTDSASVLVPSSTAADHTRQRQARPQPLDRLVSQFQQTATPLGSVERLQPEARMVRSPGLEVDIELAAPAPWRSAGASETMTSIAPSMTS